MTKKEKANYFRKLFYQKWGNYENYLKYKKPKKKKKWGKGLKKKARDNLWLKVHNNGKELWISPKGTNEEYFLTRGKITIEEIKNWRAPENKLKLI